LIALPDPCCRSPTLDSTLLKLLRISPVNPSRSLGTQTNFDVSGHVCASLPAAAQLILQLQELSGAMRPSAAMNLLFVSPFPLLPLSEATSTQRSGCPHRRRQPIMRARRASRRRTDSDSDSSLSPLSNPTPEPHVSVPSTTGFAKRVPDARNQQPEREPNVEESPTITRDARLREEIAHPFRRVKVTVFGTLAISAAIGTLFATGRVLLGADAIDVYGVNCLVNVPAVLLFGWLAKREVDFGRRALGIIAKCSQARDLPLEAPPGVSSAPRRVGDLVLKGDLYIVAGRARDVADALLDSGGGDDTPAIVACALDTGVLDATYLGLHVSVAASCAPQGAQGVKADSEEWRAWGPWAGRVKRGRRDVAVFYLPKGDLARGLGDEYVLAVGAPGKVDLRTIFDARQPGRVDAVSSSDDGDAIDERGNV
jgi:Low psii accumulation1 / Rep27